ncbi:hypothetical protein BBAD15_g12015 [Beauveria bassiana D1-5]|uniref:Uncharacterized protein n=1 Tax=Beauveria bassiana D1-5 TaxID=1245745 RepID=A0A0A2V8X6_BEABA|nr:hypothetical protein BBAD15_g12015 [Beauveria bassiana D1-5]
MLQYDTELSHRVRDVLHQVNQGHQHWKHLVRRRHHVRWNRHVVENPGIPDGRHPIPAHGQHVGGTTTSLVVDQHHHEDRQSHQAADRPDSEESHPEHQKVKQQYEKWRVAST